MNDQLIAYNGQVLPMVGNFIFVRPEQLPIKIALMKFRLNAQRCLSRPN